MQKIYGATERQDGLYTIGRSKFELIYGFGKDNDEDESGYNYRQRFTKKPTLTEVKHIIIDQINANVDEKILTGFVWNGISVYLSEENQRNYKAAYDLAYQFGGQSLPIKFKLGENEDEEAVYFTFEDMDTFADFYTKAIAYINTCLNEGWAEKDGIDWTKYGSDE